MDLKEYLKDHRIITDGAMGTYYDHLSGRCAMAEEANLVEPDVIKKIHKEYIAAGARLIRANTYAANERFFQPSSKIKDIIRSAMAIARMAVTECRREGILETEEQVYIAADIGPIHEEITQEHTSVTDAYQYLVDCFLEEKPDAFVFETLSEWGFLKETARYIKERTESYVLAQFSFDRSGYTKSGLGLSSMLKEVGAIKDIDAYGFNCGMASAHLYHFIKEASFAEDKQVSALPNSSYPDVVRGKVIYTGPQNYFVNKMEEIDKLGVRILGGCCGTTPSHIRKLSEHLLGKPVSAKKVDRAGETGTENTQTAKNYIVERIQKGQKVIMVELDPPFDGNYQKVVEGALYLKGKGTDIITLSDSPLARARMDAGLLAARVIADTGMRVMPHIACRDRNKIALRGLIMGMHANNVRNLLLVTGDPITAGESVKSVYEMNSIRLMEFVHHINEEMFAGDRMYYGGALNYHGVNADAIAARICRKMGAGAAYFLTQPVYSDDDIARLRLLKEKTKAAFIVGIMPLVSHRNAMFIQNEMSGINIPREVMDMYQENLSREQYEQIAVDVCVKIVEKLGDTADGYYFMTPFNRYGLIQKIIDRIV